MRRLLGLDGALATARREAFSAGHPGWKEYRLGCAALSHARALGAAGRTNHVAALLGLSALRLTIDARRARRGSVPADRDLDYVAALQELGGVGVATNDPERARLIAESIGPQGERFVASLETAELTHAWRALEDTTLALGLPLRRESARVTRQLALRALRLGALSLALGAGLWGLLHQPNLALKRPVSVPHADAEYPPEHLVDGNRANIGFHSTKGPHQATIDLGLERSISSVVVYNRADCCQERALPLRIEVGDGSSFRRVAERRSSFNVWRAGFPKTQARYVRLVSDNREPFHLAEVEVY